MSGDTGRLYLDQLQALGVEGSAADRGYPPITADEKRVLSIVALNIFVSQTSLMWAYFDAIHGKSEGFKTIRERLLSPSVKMTVG